MKRLSFFLSLFVLAACGFHPVHGVNKYTSVGVQEKLAQVSIENIPDREGQFLRNALIDRFYKEARPANPSYTLAIAPIAESLSDLDITKTADSTRGQLRLDTQIRLTDRRTGQLVLERSLRAITSYNILGSEYATRVSEQNTRENALNDLARQIEQQVTLYFKRVQ